jgi:hypothetical protein
MAEMSPEEVLVSNGEVQAGNSERLRTTRFGDVLAGEGIATIARDDLGYLVRRDPDGTTTCIERLSQSRGYTTDG